MNKFLILISFCISSFAVADGHGNLGLEKRQPDAAMNVTSVTLGQDLSTISAEGDMEGYGKVYATYHLTYDVERTSGIVEGQGRGFTAEGYAYGRFQGMWELVEGVIVMRNVVSINNGTVNLDVIEFNPLTRSLIVQAYILK